MRLTLIAGLLFALTTCTYSQKIKVETVYYSYPNEEEIASEYSIYKKGKKVILHGVYKEYFEDGNLFRIRTFQHGNIEGEAKEYFRYGQLKSLNKYEGGKRVGQFQEFYENGMIRKEGFCTNDSSIITKYGFANGDFSVLKSDSIGEKHFTFYSSDGEVISYSKYQSKVDLEEKITCTLNYPKQLIEFDLDGIVVAQLNYNKFGQLVSYNILAGFHEAAIQSVSACLDANIINTQPSESSLDIQYSSTETFTFIIY